MNALRAAGPRLALGDEMYRSRLRTAIGLAVLCASLVGFTACGGEAESKDEEPADTAEALHALRREVRELRAELRGMSATNEGLQSLVARLEVELVDAGPKDPYLHERLHEMDYIARKWRDKAFKRNVEGMVESIQKMGHRAIYGIVPFLRDTDSDNRIAALFVLGEMGPAAYGALDYVRERLKDPDASVCAAARRTICEITD